MMQESAVRESPTPLRRGASAFSRIAVVIPAYRVARHLPAVVAALPDLVERIYVIDDACPEGSGSDLQANSRDPRLKVLFNEENLGVGGAVLRGYRAAIAQGADIVVKVDGEWDPLESTCRHASLSIL